MKRIIGLVAAVLCVIFLFGPVMAADEAQKGLLEIVVHVNVHLVTGKATTDDQDWIPFNVRVCTGFIFDSHGKVITVAHAVSAREAIKKAHEQLKTIKFDRLRLEITAKAFNGEYFGTIEIKPVKPGGYLSPNRKFAVSQPDTDTFKLLYQDETEDLSVFTINTATPNHFTFGKSSELKPDEPLYALRMIDGKVHKMPLRFSELGEYKLRSKWIDIIICKPAVQNGFSGGPVVRANNEVVGVTFRFSLNRIENSDGDSYYKLDVPLDTFAITSEVVEFVAREMRPWLKKVSSRSR